MTSPMTALAAEDVVVAYDSRGGSLLAVSGASVRVGAGEVVGIVGDSGSGKSSLLLALLGMTRPGARIVAGSVRYGNTELIGASPATLAEVRGVQVGFVTQHPKASLNPLARVGEQILSVLVRSGQCANRREAARSAVELFRSVGIADPERRLRAYPHELSGGLAQRALIALALAKKPRVLLADEPTSGLDATLQTQVLDTLCEGARAVGSSLVIVTHDFGVVAQYCDRVYLMNSGEVVEAASVSGFFRSPRHPAALALLTTEDSNRELGLRGLPTDRRNLPGGCFLNRRCVFAREDSHCFDVHPELTEVADGHLVRCHRQADVAESRQP